MTKARKLKKAIKTNSARVANLALGKVPGAKYRDLYNAIFETEQACRRATETRHKKLVLFAHKRLIDMAWVRELAHSKKF